MKKIVSDGEYTSKIRQAVEGNVVATLEVTAHRVHVASGELHSALADMSGAWGGDKLAAALGAADRLMVLAQGERWVGERHGPQDPAFIMNLCGGVANALHSVAPADDGEARDIIAIWQRIAHLQYLTGLIYPAYISVMKEVALLERANLNDHSLRLRRHAQSILELDETLDMTEAHHGKQI